MEQHKKISFQNTAIHYTIYGSGKPVMMVHGFAEDSSIFKDQVNYLKENYLIIVPDLPGIGKSEMLQKENVQISDYADILKAIIDEEKIDSYTMLGHSLGGYITLAYAEKYGKTLNAFGLLHSSAYADDDAKIATRKKAIQFIAENGSGAFLKTSIPGLFFDAEKSKNEISELVEFGNSFNPKVLIQQYNAMIARPDTTSVLKNLQQPILMVMGEHDKAVPFAQSLEQSHLPKIAYIHILRNSAHMGMKEETENVNKILAEFLHSV